MTSPDQEFPLNFQFPAKNGFLVVVRPFLMGQFRLQLCHGDEFNIVRECCTYSRPRAIRVKDDLLMADDPRVYLESLVSAKNCEYPGGRIRLDAK